MSEMYVDGPLSRGPIPLEQWNREMIDMLEAAVPDVKVEVHALEGYVSDAYLDPALPDGSRHGEWKHTGEPLVARWVDAEDRWVEVVEVSENPEQVWRWYCRIDGASGECSTREDRDTAALHHRDVDCQTAGLANRQWAESGHLVHVWSYGVPYAERAL